MGMQIHTRIETATERLPRHKQRHDYGETNIETIMENGKEHNNGDMDRKVITEEKVGNGNDY